MNEELFNEAARSNILSKKLIDQLQESMNYSSISFINWTIEVLTLIKNRLERGDKITDEVSGTVYTVRSFREFVKMVYRVRALLIYTAFQNVSDFHARKVVAFFVARDKPGAKNHQDEYD